MEGIIMNDKLPCSYCGKTFDKSSMRMFDYDTDTTPEYLCDRCYDTLKEVL